MYESWFRLSKRPFNAPPQTADYFADQGIESAREALLRCIERHAGPGVVIGDHGTGKSLLSLLLLRQCRFVRKVAHVSAPGIGSRKELMQTILFEFGLPYNLQDEGQLRLSLIDFLTSSDATRDGAVLIVDDAHELSLDLLEQLASMSDLVRDGQWCVNLVLFGQPSLEDQLTRPTLASLNQRIAARYYLRNWSRNTTRDYIRFQLHQADANVTDVFDEPALDTVYDATGGIPRLINQVCDHAMILASAGGLAQINEETIREAWSDLQSLPAELPSTAPGAAMTGDDPIVEFGTLDDHEPPVIEELAGRQDSPTVDPSNGDEEGTHGSESCAREPAQVDHDYEPEQVELGALRDGPVLEFDFSSPPCGDSAVDECSESTTQPLTKPFDVKVGRFEDQANSSGNPGMRDELQSAPGSAEDYAIDDEVERRLSDDSAASYAYDEPDETPLDLPGEVPMCPTESEQAIWQNLTPTEPQPVFESDPDMMLDTIEQQLFDAELPPPAEPTDPPWPHDDTRISLDNPFLESFDEEEVVISRSASLDVDLVARQPSVVTEQGGSLVDVLRLLESGWEGSVQNEYEAEYGYEDRIVASPELSSAVAAAVAAHNNRSSQCRPNQPTLEQPDNTYESVEPPNRGANDASLESPYLACPSFEQPAEELPTNFDGPSNHATEVVESANIPPYDAKMPGTELYGSLDVIPGASSGDQFSNFDGDPANERSADVIIAGFDGSLIGGPEQDPRFENEPLQFDSKAAPAASQQTLDSPQIAEQPPAEEHQEAQLPSDPEAATARTRKPRRFGSLFSGLRDR